MSASGPIYLPLPIWVRMPSPTSVEHYTGLKRGKLYVLCVPCPANKHRPPVRSIVVNETSADESAAQENPSPAPKGRRKRAVRLIRLSSLLAHLEKLDNEQHLQIAA